MQGVFHLGGISQGHAAIFAAFLAAEECPRGPRAAAVAQSEIQTGLKKQRAIMQVQKHDSGKVLFGAVSVGGAVTGEQHLAAHGFRQ